MKMKKYILTFVFLSTLLLSSCDFLDGLDKYPEVKIEYASTYPISGEYWAEFSYEAYGDLFGAGLVNTNIYNTAADDGKEVWITDRGNYWDFKVKCAVNMDNLTFGSPDTMIDEQWGIKVVIRNGKLMEGASVQPSGVAVDSIYYEIWLEDLGPYLTSVGYPVAADEYMMCSGFRRTGFLEDEH
jgi:hypothetical protein